MLGKEQNQDELLTEDDASKLLALSKRTLQFWRFVGKGPQYMRMSG
jgi:hypothetical protein